MNPHSDDEASTIGHGGGVKALVLPASKQALDRKALLEASSPA
jgi:hypothetical protein